MPLELRLSPNEARLVSLAIAYHLGRPGSEIDPTTLQASRHGLTMPAAILEAQAGFPEAKLTLELEQVARLRNAMLQTISELKVISMSEAPWSPVTGSASGVNRPFETALADAFPSLREDPSAAQSIAASLMQLLRQLASVEQEPRPPQPPPDAGRHGPRHTARPRPWWRLWDRR